MEKNKVETTLECLTDAKKQGTKKCKPILRNYRLWFNRIMAVIMGGLTLMGFIYGTQSGRPYDERTYILVLTIIALILFMGLADNLTKKK